MHSSFYLAEILDPHEREGLVHFSFQAAFVRKRQEELEEEELALKDLASEEVSSCLLRLANNLAIIQVLKAV